MTSRRHRVDRGRLYTPQCCVIVLLTSGPRSLLCHHVALQLVFTRPNQSTPHPLSFFAFNLGLIPWYRLSRFFNFSEFLKQPFFFGLSHPCSAWRALLNRSPEQSMPRRPPPTPLHLVQGPLPPRGISKFTMPSIPRPIFHPQTVVGERPVPRERVHSNRVGVAARETGWRVPKSPSPCTVGRARVGSVTTPFGVLVKPPKAAGTG